MNARLAALATLLAGAGLASLAGCHPNKGNPSPTHTPSPAACDAGDVSFVRNATLAIVGHRPMGQSEVNALAGSISPASTSDTINVAGRIAVVNQLLARPEYADRWSEHFYDELRVPRMEDQDMRGCYGNSLRSPDDGSLARYVRDNPATGTGDGNGAFTMRDLLDSAIVADDLSPAYRGHLFPLVAFPIPAANVGPVEAELARRQDFGNVFDSAYLNRDIVCMQCHNSEFSVTYNQDPALNRHWPLPGHFESALYGAATGIDPDRAHAVFRFDGFADGSGSSHPWGSSSACAGPFGGGFQPSLGPDIAGIDGKFGNLTGDQLSVYDLEASLKAGVDSIAANGLQVGGDGTIADPDQAFAYLVAASIVEGVWRDVTGSPLTIANYFPRNQAERDELKTLTDDFVAHHFSLATLLTDITISPYFNKLPPEAGCSPSGTGYDLPDIFDPWVKDDADPARRLNSAADGVAALNGRVLVRSAYAALEWPQPDAWTFPNSDTEASYDRGIGLFLKNGERGFRGLDFQARLVWENKVARCAKPAGASNDFIDQVASAAGTQSATIRDVVLAMKDRMLGEASIDDATEKAPLEAIFGGQSLDSAASSDPSLSADMRKLCGVYLSTPQFLLQGFASSDTPPVPKLNP